MSPVIKTTWRHGSQEITDAFTERACNDASIVQGENVPKTEPVRESAPVRAYSKDSVTINGVVFETVRQAAERLGLTYNVINYRIRVTGSRTLKVNLRALRAITASRSSNKTIDIKIDDNVYHGYDDATRKTGFSKRVIRDAIKQSMSLEIKSCNIRKQWAVPVIVDGVSYESARVAADKTGKPYSALLKLAKKQRDNVETTEDDKSTTQSA